MTKEDQNLLKIYMRGFSDELYSKPKLICLSDIEQSAYDWGRNDAIVGDDVPSIDYQTEEEILNKIKNK